MVLVIQQIKSKWTKNSRGGSGAVRRNAVPEVVGPPTACARDPSPSALYYSVLYYESNGFTSPTEDIVENPPLPMHIGGVTVDVMNDEANATFSWTRACGAPDRGWAHKKLVIRHGEWSQIVYNGRLSVGWDSVWWYEKTVVNVGLFDSVSPDVFTGHAPADRFEAMGNLH